MTEKVSHTPGPWAVADDGWTVKFMNAGEPRPHRQIQVEGFSHDEVVANANLIAAAPDLLAALKGLQALVIGECGGSMLDCVDGERACAAIAKAEGRSR